MDSSCQAREPRHAETTHLPVVQGDHEFLGLLQGLFVFLLRDSHLFVKFGFLLLDLLQPVQLGVIVQATILQFGAKVLGGCGVAWRGVM